MNANKRRRKKINKKNRITGLNFMLNFRFWIDIRMNELMNDDDDDDDDDDLIQYKKKIFCVDFVSA